MSTISLPLNEILARLMFQRRIRPTDLARHLNIPQPTLSRIANGISLHPHESSLRPLADFFGITIEQLRGLEPIPWLEPSTREEEAGWCKIPLIEWEEASIAKADFSALTQNPQLFTDAVVSKRAYALCMQDASMEPQFPKGTILVIDPDKSPRDRSFVLVQLENYPEAILRQLIMDGPNWYLKPTSADFEQFKMSQMQDGDKVLGVLVQARRNYEE